MFTQGKIPSNRLGIPLRNDIQCPSCKQQVLPPFTTCMNKHVICKNCMRNLHKCQHCQRLIEEMRQAMQPPPVRQENVTQRNREVCPKCEQEKRECENGHIICPQCMKDVSNCANCKNLIKAKETTERGNQAISKDITCSILNELECPGCHEFMLPPIKMCENGHNICTNCILKCKDCPICETTFQEAQNIALENIARQVHYPCRYSKEGCLQTYIWAEIREHEGDCSYSKVNCPISDDGDILCPWKNKRHELKNHLILNHGNKFWEISEFLPQTIINVNKNVFYDTAICIYDEIFYKRLEYIEAGFYGFVQYIGPRYNAQKYKYKITLVRPEGVQKISGSYITHEYKEEKNQIFASQNCFKISHEQLETFLNENRDLRTITKITKIS